MDATASIIAITGAAIASVRVLYKVAHSFASHGGTIRRLENTLKALEDSLRMLEKSVAANAALFATLSRPLEHCNLACDEFAALFAKCTKHGGVPEASEAKAKTNPRDWLTLQRRGKDIKDLVDELKGYNDIINIALAAETLRTCEVTFDTLAKFKDMIQSTWDDFEERIDGIDAKLDLLNQSSSAKRRVAPGTGTGTGTSIDIAWALEERDSAKHCLAICSHLQAQFQDMWFQPALGKLVQPQAPGDEADSGVGSSISSSSTTLTRAQLMTLSGFRDCADTISRTVSELSLHHRQAESLAQAASDEGSSRSSSPSADGTRDRERLKDEQSCFKQCAAFCNEATQRAERAHVISNVSVGRNGTQLIVSTFNDLFRVSNVTAAEGSKQMIGVAPEAVILEALRP